MENANSQLGELAVLDELAQVGKGLLLRVGNKLDEVEHALDNSSLELVASLVAQDTAKESKHASLLAGELEAECSDSFDNRNLELVGDLGHEPSNLLHQSIHAGFVAGLQ
jgi:hypothetical protein